MRTSKHHIPTTSQNAIYMELTRCKDQEPNRLKLNTIKMEIKGIINQNKTGMRVKFSK
uniref:Uncharacterized protein n=1 Tax=Arion vulgaris TaxID=1028688 RepID=A0A0B6ZUK6_9EUPU